MTVRIELQGTKFIRVWEAPSRILTVYRHQYGTKARDLRSAFLGKGTTAFKVWRA